MKFTVNTDNQTITILGSFKAEDFAAMMSKLPEEWHKFNFIGPVEEVRVYPNWPPTPRSPQQPWQPVWPLRPSQPSLPNPLYPIITYGTSKQ